MGFFFIVADQTTAPPLCGSENILYNVYAYLGRGDFRKKSLAKGTAWWYDGRKKAEGGKVMEQATVLEYKCPSCDAGLVFDGQSQQLICEYCGNSYPLEEIQALQGREAQTPQSWEQEEQEQLNAFRCPSCAGEILCRETTAATFCPYCGNPTVLPTRLSGELKPDGVIPFQRTKEEAAEAFRRLCRGKPLLPRAFQRQQLEKLTGVYVPFWLFDGKGTFEGWYKATTVTRWSDSRYYYARTSNFHVERDAVGSFTGVPMDGSSRMSDVLMESIEPYDYGKLEDFDMAYLTGYLADQYDVPAESCKKRIQERMGQTLQAEAEQTIRGYATTVPVSRKVQLVPTRTRYVLMPVWMCSTKYKDKVYTFAMNGQTGKMTGDLPISYGRAGAWFAGIFAAVTLLTALGQLVLG